MTAEPLEELVIASLHRGIQARMAVGEQLAPGIALAAERIANSFLGGGQLLIAGIGAGRLPAALLHQGVALGFDFPRPALPSILLEDGGATSGEENPLAARIRALGRAQDCLALIVPQEMADPAAGVALRAAHSRDLPCILLGGATGDQLPRELATPDIELSAGTEHLSLALDVQFSAIFALCALIERHLFGGSAT